MEQEIKVGNTILVEQAWEDEHGYFHDEYAEVLDIKLDGELKLSFKNVNKETRELLDDFEFNVRDF